MENKKFIIDKQTLEDLNIMGRYKPGSIFSLFLELQTRGGERYLEQIFNDPMTDAKSINARAEQFEYFKGIEAQFPVPDEMFQATEEYLSNAEGAGMVVAMINGLRRKVLELVARDKEF
jgi:DNA mismatch repair ATPase MutS